MSSPQCGSCHGEYGKCIHTAGLTLPAYVSTPAQAAEMTQKDYVPGNRAVEIPEDSSEPYRGPSVIYGARGDVGPQGPQGPTGARGAVGKDGKDCDPREVFKQAQAALETTYLDHLKAMREYFDKRLHTEVTDYIKSLGDLRGLQGPAGIAGIAGERGPMGSTGERGPQGLQGVPGAIGPVGERGPAGESIRGPQGDRGPQGLKGDAGEMGLRGGTGRPGDISMAVAAAEKEATIVARSEIKILASELRVEIMKELQEIKNGIPSTRA